MYVKKCGSFIKYQIMSRTKIISLTVLILFTSFITLQAQALKITAGNTAIGALNGALLGLGGMGITNDSENLVPLRVGVGLGTIYGLGVGIYDVYQNESAVGNPSNFGVLHSSEYLTMITLFDTMYGGATGAVVGMAVSLISGTSIKKGFTQGGSVGIFGGFIFGLADAFYLSKNRTGGFEDSDYTTSSDGFVTLSVNPNFKISFIQPQLLNQPVLDQGIFKQKTTTTLQVAHFKYRF